MERSKIRGSLIWGSDFVMHSVVIKRNFLIKAFFTTVLLVGAFYPFERIRAEMINYPLMRNPFVKETELLLDGQTNEKQKIAYLTFDDGPSFVVTAKILDILKDNDVKATFFVVGKEIKGREKLLARIYREGHSIGLHTYTHNFKQIYKSREWFLHELRKNTFVINELLGIKPVAVRFPGGSAGVLSYSFLQELHDEKYKIYDWNVNLGDGLHGKVPVSKLIENSKKVKGNPNVRLILAHCNYNNINTCRALPEIIRYYKEEGFEFKAIRDNTQEYYFKFR